MRPMLLAALALAVAHGGPIAADASDTVIEVLAVRNRPAADLVPPLQAVLGADATVTALDSRLIVRAPRALMPQVRALVTRLDVRPRSLRVTVRQGRTLEADGRSAGVSVVAGPGGVVAGGHVARGREGEVSEDVHQVLALEGTPAWITLGQAVPVPTAVVAPTPVGPSIVSGTTYQQVDRGFWVVARVAGDRVTLEIETALDEARAEGAIESQGVSTTVSGRLGEWIALGEIGQEASARGSGILSTGQAQRSDLRTVEVRIEEVR